MKEFGGGCIDYGNFVCYINKGQVYAARSLTVIFHRYLTTYHHCCATTIDITCRTSSESIGASDRMHANRSETGSMKMPLQVGRGVGDSFHVPS